MSSTSAIPPPPAGLNYIAAIEPSLTFILVMTPLGAVIVPILILLFFFSTPVTRSHPVFYLNIFACLMGIVETILNGVMEVKQIIHPTENISRAFFLATMTSSTFAPIIIDSILLTRVLAFYPSRTSTPMDRLKVLIVPIIIKCGRITANTIYYVKFNQKALQLDSVLLVANVIWYRNPYSLTEWTLQMVDNAYCSIFFLYKLRLFDKAGRSGWVDRHPTVLSRLRGLFYIALGNFVFPIAFNIAQIVLVSSEHSFLRGAYLLEVNFYVSIIGVVFATIWTTGQSWNASVVGSTGSTWNQEEESDRADSLQHQSARAKQTLAVRLPSPRFVSKARADSIGEGDDEDSFEMRGVRTGSDPERGSLKVNLVSDSSSENRI